jgi:hypothetical protein
MIKLWMALALLLPRLALAAPDAPSALSPAAAAAAGTDEDPGVYTAPLDGAADDDASAPAAGSRLSHARLHAFAWGRPAQDLPGVELYLDGALMGHSPMTLDGAVVSAAGVSLGARAEGYEDALRPALQLPDDGGVAVALLPEDAAWPVTTPGWAVGLGLVAAGVLVYRSDSPGTGLALAGAGLLGAGLTQLWARFVTLPRLRAAVNAYNARPQAEPVP